MEIGRSFSFVFEDQAWITKILLAAAILLLGIVFSPLLLIPLILAYALLGGYMVEIIRQVLGGDLEGLPEWDNWGTYMVEGLKVFVIGIVYALPIIVLYACILFPVSLATDNPDVVSPVLGCFGCLSLLWAIAISVVLPAAVANYVAKDDLHAAFRFGEVFTLVGNNLSTYLITFLMTWVAGFIGSLGGLVCGLGSLVTMPYAYMVTGHLWGQAFVEATSQASVAVPVPEESVEES